MAHLSSWRCCAVPSLVLALGAIFASAAQAGVIVEVGAGDIATAALESVDGGSSSQDVPPSQSHLSRLDQHALYGSGGAESSGSQSGSSNSSSPFGASVALSSANVDAARTGGQWRSVTEFDEPRVMRDALDSVFHPPRGES